jgi:hypothetical protein
MVAQLFWFSFQFPDGSEIMRKVDVNRYERSVAAMRMAKLCSAKGVWQSQYYIL